MSYAVTATTEKMESLYLLWKWKHEYFFTITQYFEIAWPAFNIIRWHSILLTILISILYTIQNLVSIYDLKKNNNAVMLAYKPMNL